MSISVTFHNRNKMRLDLCMKDQGVSLEGNFGKRMEGRMKVKKIELLAIFSATISLK